MKRPFFSIIVPSYCGSGYVAGIIDNVVLQGLNNEDWELILVDDASPDDSVPTIREIIRPYGNVRLLVNDYNRRQGGGVITGLRKPLASG